MDASILKALCEPNRFLLLQLMSQRGYCVRALAQKVDCPSRQFPSTSRCYGRQGWSSGSSVATTPTTARTRRRSAPLPWHCPPLPTPSIVPARGRFTAVRRPGELPASLMCPRKKEKEREKKNVKTLYRLLWPTQEDAGAGYAGRTLHLTDRYGLSDRDQ